MSLLEAAGSIICFKQAKQGLQQAVKHFCCTPQN